MPQIVDGEVTEEDVAGCRTYGMCLYGEQGWSVYLSDVDTDRDRVSRLVERLIGETVDEEQLRHLVEDRLAQWYDYREEYRHG